MRIAHRQHFGWRDRPLAGALGLRPVVAQHTQAEGELLARLASGANRVVEIGVAEGASAAEMRSAMSPSSELVLIDPYVPTLGVSFQRLIARRVVKGPNVRWVRALSHEAVKGWRDPIGLLFIDGDHTYGGVRRDFDDWTPFLVPGGLVALHDARVESGWTEPHHGPARLLAELDGWEQVAGVDSLAVLRSRS